MLKNSTTDEIVGEAQQRPPIEYNNRTYQSCVKNVFNDRYQIMITLSL